MFQIKSNEEIGAYLHDLINKSSHKNIRQFCIKYLELSETSNNDDQDRIRNMCNRMSQIINGKKAIQTYDLPIFCELLHVSCEEILSAGNHFVPISNHLTNYEIAFSKDRDTWERYINMDDKLILNPDEYNKTVIDYAIDFKNYAFLKYLVDTKRIWFVDNSICDCTELAFGFGAGTDIKRREIGFTDTLNCRMMEQQNELRQKMIALAMKNEDFEMLTSLRSRENPAMYKCMLSNPKVSFEDYLDKKMIMQLSRTSEKIINYFTEDFTIVDKWGHKHSFIYPYISHLIELLLKNKSRYAEAVIRRVISHNHTVLTELQKTVNENFELTKIRLKYIDDVEILKDDAMYGFKYDQDNDIVKYRGCKTDKGYICLCANIVYIKASSDDLLIKSLIEESNSIHKSICNISPDIS